MTSTRGAHGGYRLARPAAEIQMLEVVQALEGPIAPMECFHDAPEGRVLCSHEADGDRACATKLLWTRVQGGVTKALAGTTLAELVEFSDQHAAPRQPPSPAEPRRLRSRQPRNGDEMAELEIRNLHVSAEGKEILKGLDLDVDEGQGPRADGAERLRQVDARQRDHGPPGARGDRGRDPASRARTSPRPTPRTRSRPGLFMAFQYPVAIPGVTVSKYLRMISQRPPRGARRERDQAQGLPQADRGGDGAGEHPQDFSSRYLNDGFSGGEKKRMEILQLAMLRPEIAVLDETDSGLDIDALRTVAEGVNKFAGPDMGVLIITHYQRILHLVKPDFVHVMFEGRIVKEGGPELVGLLEEQGYGWIREEVEAAA